MSAADPAPRHPDPATDSPSERDVELVTSQLGREPAGTFAVVVRAEDGSPAVIANPPFLFDGTPMPTRYWLSDPTLREAVSRLESAGGVRAAEEAVDADRLADAHLRYEAERDALIASEPSRPAPVGRSRGDQARREVPPRASRMVVGGRRRSGRGVDRGSDRPAHGVRVVPHQVWWICRPPW